MWRPPYEVVLDIIKTQLSLPDGSIFLAEEDYTIPKQEGLFIALQVVSSKPYGISQRFIPTPEGQEGGQEVICEVTRDIYDINIMSYSIDALSRSNQVRLCLRSQYSNELQEKYSCNIGTVGGIRNLSHLEGGSTLSRYSFEVAINGLYTLMQNIAYYDTFLIEGPLVN